MAYEVSKVTGIAIAAIEIDYLRKYCVVRKTSWAAERVATHPKDHAGRLVAFFDVNMPLSYRERKRKRSFNFKKRSLKTTTTKAKPVCFRAYFRHTHHGYA